MVSFNFGKNWLKYSVKALNREKIQDAISDLKKLAGETNIKGKTFLDIGSGSGVHSIAAEKAGASKVVGFDISKESIEASNRNAELFNVNDGISFEQCSILSKDHKKYGAFDTVYSWGVLHHTGAMWKAIKNSMGLVNNKGLFILAIYNRHWSSFAWKLIKYIYNISPQFIKKIIIFIFYGIIFVAKFLVTFKNPLKKRRGMNFYYDVIDWLGGYPYEYASKNEIIHFFYINNFRLIKYIKPQVPTGCGEFVFQKK